MLREDSDVALVCALRFPGQWEDEESGLHYNLNRYYDPDTGQYLSPDPIGIDGGLRTQAYVHDPLDGIDPLGLAGCSAQPTAHGAEPPRVCRRLQLLRRWSLYEQDDE